MSRAFAQLTFTDSVKAAQARYGSRELAERHAGGATAGDVLGAREREFIAARDSFYLATVGESGWPYVQHRGGSPGFLEVLDDRTLAFPDFRGNLQYQSVGNIGANDRVCLILVDYPQRRRLKVLGRAQVVDVLPPPHVLPPSVVAERLLLIAVEAFDWNCSRFITPRFSERELCEMSPPDNPLRRRIVELEARLRELGCEPPAWIF